jgi:ABC-type microcin C transport system permease subunit YejE
MSQNLFDALFQGPKDVVMANRVVQVAVYVSLFMALVTAIVAVLGFYQTSEDPHIQYFLDPWMSIDVVLMLFLTFFLYKRKLWAAICLVVYQIINVVVVYIDLNRLPGALFILKMALFVSAATSIHLINKEKESPASTVDS